MRPDPRPRRFRLALSSLLLGLAALPVQAAPATYNVDRAHSSVGFEVRHFFNDVPGRFTDFDGQVIYDPESVGDSRIELVVKTESIDTDLERRDQHLRSGDFFDAETHPELSFRSTHVAAGEAENQLRVTGDLTIRGKTQRLTVPVEILGLMELGDGAAKAAFQTEFVIDRQAFDVKWNRQLDNGGTVLGNEVRIRVVLQLDRVVKTEG
ncbi:MAG: YceI family protein [Holophagales bacterium]|nr:YceI family protein [Holophagales bacterium]